VVVVQHAARCGDLLQGQAVRARDIAGRPVFEEKRQALGHIPHKRLRSLRDRRRVLSEADVMAGIGAPLTGADVMFCGAQRMCPTLGPTVIFATRRPSAL
jgi:hypothetical protein